jgi:hypothetical protein
LSALPNRELQISHQLADRAEFPLKNAANAGESPLIEKKTELFIP